MEKILVPTDFSNNSKSGLRFAIRLAARNKSPLVFVHTTQIERPLKEINEADYEAHKQQEIEKLRDKLQRFITGVYRALKQDEGEYSCEIVEGIKADISLIDYCKKHQDIGFIVISTRGASFLNKVLGTNTGNLITKSPIPVIAVPKDYRSKPLRNILYSTDLENLEKEFDTVLKFAKPRGLSVEVLHFSTPSTLENEGELEKLDVKAGYPVKVLKKKADINKSMINKLQEQIEKTKPSMVALFTNQERTFFEKLFLSSMAEELSFKSQVPLLVFNKQVNFKS